MVTKDYGREYYTKNPQSTSSSLTNDMLTFKHASGGMEALGLTLRSLGMRNTELYETVFKINAAVKLMIGSITLARGIAQLYKQEQKRQLVKASTLTAKKTAEGPSGWATIALATGVTAGAYIVMANLTKNIQRSEVDISDKYAREKEGNEMRKVFWS